MGNTYVLRKGVSELSDLKNGASALGALMANGGNWYYCDPTHGHAGAGAETPDDATNSLESAYALCRDGYNDGVIFIGGATAFNPTAAITWSKSYCHLVGLSADLAGLGQRCRVVALAATALTVPITFSGAGNVIRNIQFYNEKAAGAAAGCVAFTGTRYRFENCFFMSPVATDAASYSMKMSGTESEFVNCTFGQFTNPRTGASYGLWLHGASSVSRNKFIHCEFLSWGYDANHVHVLVDVDIVTVPWVTWFENCLFDHVGTALTQGIDDNCTSAGHQIVLRGRDGGFLNAAAVADTLTYIFAPDADDAVSGQLMIAVVES